MRIKDIFRRKKYAQGGVVREKEPEYIEKDTKCDICVNLGDCIDEGILIDAQTMRDIRKHYVLELGGECRKDPVVQARDAYVAYKHAYGDIIRAITDVDIDMKRVERLSNILENSQKVMFDKMDVLFGLSEEEIKS